jgi:hypothetical protein
MIPMMIGMGSSGDAVEPPVQTASSAETTSHEDPVPAQTPALTVRTRTSIGAAIDDDDLYGNVPCTD